MPVYITTDQTLCRGSPFVSVKYDDIYCTSTILRSRKEIEISLWSTLPVIYRVVLSASYITFWRRHRAGVEFLHLDDRWRRPGRGVMETTPGCCIDVCAARVCVCVYLYLVYACFILGMCAFMCVL